jgi:hypothetical protein
VRDQAAAAAIAHPAADQRRHDHQVAWPDAAYAIADAEHLSHALVADRVRVAERASPEDRDPVDVARRRGDGPHERLAVAAQLRLWCVAPLEQPGPDKHQLPHIGCHPLSSIRVR